MTPSTDLVPLLEKIHRATAKSLAQALWVQFAALARTNSMFDLEARINSSPFSGQT
jgi:hypothetical protein